MLVNLIREVADDALGVMITFPCDGVASGTPLPCLTLWSDYADDMEVLADLCEVLRDAPAAPEDMQTWHASFTGRIALSNLEGRDVQFELMAAHSDHSGLRPTQFCCTLTLEDMQSLRKGVKQAVQSLQHAQPEPARDVHVVGDGIDVLDDDGSLTGQFLECLGKMIGQWPCTQN